MDEKQIGTGSSSSKYLSYLSAHILDEFRQIRLNPFVQSVHVFLRYFQVEMSELVKPQLENFNEQTQLKRVLNFIKMTSKKNDIN